MLEPLVRSAMVALITSAVPASASPHAQSRWFSTQTNPLFADARAQLQTMVDEDGHHAANRFCVVGERNGADQQAYVHWLSENRLILWEPQRGNPRAIAGSRRNLDLARDVVDGDDVRGSTYLLTRATADRILRACREKGTRYLVTKTVIPRG